MSYSKGIKLEDELTEDIINTAIQIVHDDGAENITVRKIINKMNVTNRVFYNRFKDIDELLWIVYERLVVSMHKSLKSIRKEGMDYYEYLMELGISVLKQTYETKLQFSHYMFEHDSLTENNRVWWTQHLKEILDYGIEHGYFKEIDTEKLSFSVWCFFRGFNVDVVDRRVPCDEAVELFRVGCGILIDGIKKTDK
ncbi:MAG: TetR/AcrR family transcriptional regulator [Bacillota bacterium]|nr:TetR/AcrR family transcriptional regulator [Bacillota bacterium]